MDGEDVSPGCVQSSRPPSKKLKLSLRSRFKEPKSLQEMEEISRGYVPPNTAKSTAWGVKVFQDWRGERSQTDSNEQCPINLLEAADPVQLNFWLPRFIVEVRKQTGEPYRPRSIQLILSALQRKMLDTNTDAPRFMDFQVS